MEMPQTFSSWAQEKRRGGLHRGAEGQKLRHNKHQNDHTKQHADFRLQRRGREDPRAFRRLDLFLRRLVQMELLADPALRVDLLMGEGLGVVLLVHAVHPHHMASGVKLGQLGRMVERPAPGTEIIHFVVVYLPAVLTNQSDHPPSRLSGADRGRKEAQLPPVAGIPVFIFIIP